MTSNVFWGPCAHGREPYERCDLCGELCDAHAEAYAKAVATDPAKRREVFVSEWATFKNAVERAIIVEGRCFLARVFTVREDDQPDNGLVMWAVTGADGHYKREYVVALEDGQREATEYATQAIQRGLGHTLDEWQE